MKDQMPIVGATKRTYQVTDDDERMSIGERLWCRVVERENAYFLNTKISDTYTGEDPGRDTTKETGFFHTLGARNNTNGTVGTDSDKNALNIYKTSTATKRENVVGYNHGVWIPADSGKKRSWEFPNTLMGQNVHDVPPILPTIVRQHQNGKPSSISRPDAREGLTSLTGFEIGDVVRLSHDEYVFGRDSDGNHHYYEWSTVKTPIQTLLREHSLVDLIKFGRKTVDDFHNAATFRDPWWRPRTGTKNLRSNTHRMSSEGIVCVDFMNHFQNIALDKNANTVTSRSPQKVFVAGFRINKSDETAFPGTSDDKKYATTWYIKGLNNLIRVTDATILKGFNHFKLAKYIRGDVETTVDILVTSVTEDNVGALPNPNTNGTSDTFQIQLASVPVGLQAGDKLCFERVKDTRPDMHADGSAVVHNEYPYWSVAYDLHRDFRKDDIVYRTREIKTIILEIDHDELIATGLVMESTQAGPVGLVRSSANYYSSNACYDFKVLYSEGHADPGLVYLYLDGLYPYLEDTFFLPKVDGMSGSRQYRDGDYKVTRVSHPTLDMSDFLASWPTDVGDLAMKIQIKDGSNWVEGTLDIQRDTSTNVFGATIEDARYFIMKKKENGVFSVVDDLGTYTCRFPLYPTEFNIKIESDDDNGNRFGKKCTFDNDTLQVTRLEVQRRYNYVFGFTRA